jgi:hypothetical protein
MDENDNMMRIFVFGTDLTAVGRGGITVPFVVAMMLAYWEAYVAGGSLDMDLLTFGPFTFTWLETLIGATAAFALLFAILWKTNGNTPSVI